MTDTTPVQLQFEAFGDSDKPVLLIVHGFFASSRNWRGVARILAQRFYVLAVDMRNHGASPHHPVMNYSVMADDLAAFIRQHGVERPHILGHSMGGKAVMWLALNHSVDLDLGKLVIADISPTRYQHSFGNTIGALKSVPLADISNRKDADHALSALLPDAGYRQFLLQNLQLQNGHYSWRVNLDIFAATADNIVGFPACDHLYPFMQEVLFVGGADSDYIHEEDVYSLFPSARVEYIENAAHWLHVQQPEHFCQLVSGFLV